MEKLVIAVDVDDVLVETAADIVADYNRRWDTQLTLKDFYGSHNLEAWGVDQEETAIRRVDEYLQSPEYFSLKPAQTTIRAITTLAKTYDLHILTGRSDIIAEATKDWVQDHFTGLFTTVNFSNLFIKDKMRSKGEMCRELGAKVLIDDHLAHIKSAIQFGLDAVLFGDYPWNQTNESPIGSRRCKDWVAVMDYLNERYPSA